ncbi:PhzF family phenazine biosynthesis protein [Aurantiacibacter gangjinensis]|uniref:PhzF family phenazine biosynthesis protein n=1 Tax=Aurantiacibacter gangjinensis TaxID=502682 RepID=A0A0G9MLJ1_9SPHN|nr:PhzF family phenazine biosynthesis protein [Aurantiacibacter gangjinensis]APE27568.1 Phenazine biosynthesis protein PhzF [Aurantiacibacter gangjinensis]KLE31611.1 PhzF family phenazine biosynthesis protein [Aurantiacibacter gangjinensis]
MSRNAIPYWHVDAFASKPFEGNQAAVMVLEEWPDDSVLQAIGEENNFAETAFVVRDESGEADWELRWFTPTCEIRLCGHATLASGHVLLTRDGGDAVRFRTRKAGILEVSKSEAGYDLALPAIPIERGEFAEAVQHLGAQPQEVWLNPDGYGIYLFEKADDVLRLEPDVRALGTLGDDQFICTAPGMDTDVVSRVFVPGGGVDEDSFTGSAHAALTPFWAAKMGRDSFTAYQASQRGGHATCTLAGDRAILSGDCVTVVEGTFHLA